MNNQTFNPDWLSPPGRTIADLIEERGLSRKEFAKKAGLPLEKVHRLMNGGLAITDDIAKILVKTLGGSVDFWYAREEQYRETIARLQSAGDERAVKAWLNELPARDMKKFGWVKYSGSSQDAQLHACLEFFGVSSVRDWRAKYQNVMSVVSFRTSLSFESQPGPVLAWLRYGEVKALEENCRPWDATKFKAALPFIRKITRNKEPKSFLPVLKKICAACGVAVIIARTPTGCHASGATKFITESRAMILLSFRYLSDDQFWFTFFHEAGHLLLHSRKAIFIEDGSDVTEEEERQANVFAQETLIPAAFQKEMGRVSLTKLELIKLAVKIGVSRGIVVGQLQHMKRLAPDKLNWLKRRFNWNQIETD